MNKLLIGLCLFFCGCESRKEKEIDTSICIQNHLSAMAKADYVQKWDAELYKSVCIECEKLYLK